VRQARFPSQVWNEMTYRGLTRAVMDRRSPLKAVVHTYLISIPITNMIKAEVA
jgi:hypothetical protein